MTENVYDLARRINEAKTMRELARRCMQMAQKDGFMDAVAGYQKIIDKWDKVLQPLEHPDAAPHVPDEYAHDTAHPREREGGE